MSSDRKPVWLDEDAHLILKQFAKFEKTSMTDVTSQLVLDHLASLESGAPAPSATAVIAAPVAAPAIVVEAPAAPEPARFVETSPDTPLEPARPEPPAPPRRERVQREDDGTTRYLGGVWLM